MPALTSAPATKRYRNNCSAFKGSVKPSDDWTKVEDLAERRRIQNRIAQRNYRNKFKERRNDSEHSVASSPARPKRQQLARAPRKEIPSPSSLESSYIVSHTMDRMFVDQNATQLPTSQPFRQVSPYQDYSGTDPVAYPMLCSTSSTTLVPEISSYTCPLLHDPPSFPTEVSGLVPGTIDTCYADYNTGFFDISHMASCDECKSAQEPYVNVRSGN